MQVRYGRKIKEREKLLERVLGPSPERTARQAGERLSRATTHRRAGLRDQPGYFPGSHRLSSDTFLAGNS